ncbi:MAG TPA: regulatory protein RecX [Puia sp.]|nr:regulatory protein RecX [Puia sp.]
MRSSGFSYSRVKTSPEKALQKLRHYCGYQERSHAEVKQKLYSLGFFEKEAEELISRLIEDGYLNEERFAISYASGKSRNNGWGRIKIRHGLEQKGISKYCILKALQSLDESEYIAGFQRIADKKWLSLRSEKNIFVKKNKWQQFLLQRGFEQSVIKTWSFPEQK